MLQKSPQEDLPSNGKENLILLRPGAFAHKSSAKTLWVKSIKQIEENILFDINVLEKSISMKNIDDC